MHTPILTYIPPGAATTQVEQLVMFPHDYALFPYLSPRPLPFTMNTSGTFRLRRAAQWLAADFRERIEHTGGLQGGKGHILIGSEYVTFSVVVDMLLKSSRFQRKRQPQDCTTPWSAQRRATRSASYRRKSIVSVRVWHYVGPLVDAWLLPAWATCYSPAIPGNSARRWYRH